jgi:hypothetical protein
MVADAFFAIPLTPNLVHLQVDMVCQVAPICVTTIFLIVAQPKQHKHSNPTKCCCSRNSSRQRCMVQMNTTAPTMPQFVAA